MSPPANKSGKGRSWFIGPNERKVIADFLRTYPADWAASLFGRARQSCLMIGRDAGVTLRSRGARACVTDLPPLNKRQIDHWLTLQHNAKANDARNS